MEALTTTTYCYYRWSNYNMYFKVPRTINLLRPSSFPLDWQLLLQHPPPDSVPPLHMSKPSPSRLSRFAPKACNLSCPYNILIPTSVHPHLSHQKS